MSENTQKIKDARAALQKQVSDAKATFAARQKPVHQHKFDKSKLAAGQGAQFKTAMQDVLTKAKAKQDELKKH